MKKFQPRYLIFILLSVSLVFFYLYYINVDVKTKVGRLMLLPNEEPIFATVSDKTKLQDQEFFKKAQNGDEVLIFTENKKVILYRPSINKIIDINILQVVEPPK